MVVWIFQVKIGTKVFIFLFVPLAIVVSTFYVNQVIKECQQTPTVFDVAGIFTKQYLAQEEINKLVVVGSDAFGVYKSAFYLDNPSAALEIISQGAACDLSNIPEGKEWALIIGDHALPRNTTFQLPMKGFTLVQVNDNYMTVDFKKIASAPVLLRTEGLSLAEEWGTWSLNKSVILEFSEPLPEKFIIHLVAYAFGPNVGREFVAYVGDNASGFTLGKAPTGSELEFSNPKRSSMIKIDVPFPTSPRELGLSGDERRLGIALIKLRIIPL